MKLVTNSCCCSASEATAIDDMKKFSCCACICVGGWFCINSLLTLYCSWKLSGCCWYWNFYFTWCWNWLLNWFRHCCCNRFPNRDWNWFQNWFWNWFWNLFWNWLPNWLLFCGSWLLFPNWNGFVVNNSFPTVVEFGLVSGAAPGAPIDSLFVAVDIPGP